VAAPSKPPWQAYHGRHAPADDYALPGSQPRSLVRPARAGDTGAEGELIYDQESRDLFSIIDGGTPTSLEIEFREYDRNNPQVWEMFCRFAFEAIEHGRDVLSVSLIVERCRWEVFVATKSNDGFKINNNHRAFYARKFMKTYPKHTDIFRTRTSVADAA
jgi:hypothetical protein